MNKHLRQIIKRVLNAASNTPQFWELNEAERTNWLISQAYLLGQLSAARSELERRRREEITR